MLTWLPLRSGVPMRPFIPGCSLRARIPWDTIVMTEIRQTASYVGYRSCESIMAQGIVSISRLESKNSSNCSVVATSVGKLRTSKGRSNWCK